MKIERGYTLGTSLDSNTQRTLPNNSANKESKPKPYTYLHKSHHITIHPTPSPSPSQAPPCSFILLSKDKLTQSITRTHLSTTSHPFLISRLHSKRLQPPKESHRLRVKSIERIVGLDFPVMATLTQTTDYLYTITVEGLRDICTTH